MRGPTIIGLLLMVALPSRVSADSFYEFIQYKCDLKGDFVQVELLGAYNEEGEALAKNKDENTWSPWQLVHGDETGRYIKNISTIKKTCVLSDGAYVIELGPDPCNYDTQGMNGAMMMAFASVTKDGKRLAFTRFGACGVVNVTVRTKLKLKPGQEPIIEQKAGDDYFK